MDLKQTAISAWLHAREHIYEAWTRETDPANLQPSVPKINQEIANFLRSQRPVDIEQSRHDRALDALESPCSRREQQMLRAVFESTQHAGAAKALAVIKEIEAIGLVPFNAPEPLPPVEVGDVHLICWMAIEQQDAAEH